MLATLAGVIIVGAGGGLIKPMQTRWEKYLSNAEAEAPKIKEEAKNAPSVKDQAETAKERLGDNPSSTPAPGAEPDQRFGASQL